MALRILRDVAVNIREDGYFSIMVEETTEQSNREQVVNLLRHVDSELNVHESVWCLLLMLLHQQM